LEKLNERTKILLIEDNPGDARLIAEYLSPPGDAGFEVTVSKRLESGKILLDKEAFAAVLLDLSLPDSEGLATLEQIQEHASSVPIIVLTGLDSDVVGIAALQKGAQDYLFKGDADRPTLVRAIRYSIERARLESQILQTNQSLEERVELRTRELEIARERASRSEKLAIIGKLSGGVAHDLRSPLGAIKNAAFYLKRKCDIDWPGQNNADIMEWIQVIDDQATRANDVITNLLSFGSSKELVFSETQISDVIRDSLASVPLGEKLALSLSVDPDLPPVLGDASQLIRVFENLVTNAQDAMENDGCLSIDAHRSGGSVKIVISDTGSGIDPENIEKIFEPLYTAKFHGTGLGLTICQEIVSKHNGSISVESEINRGTSFTIFIPVAA